jgi:hypothetical protein
MRRLVARLFLAGCEGTMGGTTVLGQPIDQAARVEQQARSEMGCGRHADVEAHAPSEDGDAYSVCCRKSRRCAVYFCPRATESAAERCKRQ